MRAFLRGPLTHPVSRADQHRRRAADGDAGRRGAGATCARRGGCRPSTCRRGPTGPSAWQVNGQRTRPHWIMVNRRGRRFTNEAANYNAFGAAFHVEDVSRFEYANLPAWLVFDQHYLDTLRVCRVAPARRRRLPAWIVAAPTLADAGRADRRRRRRARGHGRALERAVRRRARSRLRPRRQRRTTGGGATRTSATSRRRRSARSTPPPFYAVEIHSGALGTKGGPRADGDAPGARPRRPPDPRPVRRRQRDGLGHRDDLRRPRRHARPGHGLRLPRRPPRRWPVQGSRTDLCAPGAHHGRSQMAVTSQNTILSHADVARRLLANVDAGTSDQSPVPDEGARLRLPRPGPVGASRWSGSSAGPRSSSPSRATCASRATSTRWRSPSARSWSSAGDDGVARTFLNVCRHRGAQVAEGCGTHPPVHLPVPRLGLRHPGPARRRARAGTRSASSTSAGSSSSPPTSGPASSSPSSPPDSTSTRRSGSAGMDDALAAAPPRRAAPLPGADRARQPQLEADRRRLRRRLPHRLPPQLHDRREVDHQPQHLRPLRAPRPDRLRQQADHADPGRARVGVAAHVGDHEHGPLRVPERVDLGPARTAADGQPPAARAHARPVDDGAVPLLPPAGRGRRGRRHRRGPPPALRARSPARRTS